MKTSAAGWMTAVDVLMLDMLFLEEKLRSICYLPNHSL